MTNLSKVWHCWFYCTLIVLIVENKCFKITEGGGVLGQVLFYKKMREAMPIVRTTPHPPFPPPPQPS